MNAEPLCRQLVDAPRYRRLWDARAPEELCRLALKQEHTVAMIRRGPNGSRREDNVCLQRMVR